MSVADKAFRLVLNHDITNVSKLLVSKPQLNSARNKNGSTLLHVACWTGNIDMVLMLLFRGADINSADDANYTPILVAIERKFTNLTLFLIERGANVEWRNEALSCPLHLAAAANDPEVLISLVLHGANVNCLDQDDASPIVLALEANNKRNIITLVQLNANLSCGVDKFNRRPLQILRDNNLLDLLAIAEETMVEYELPAPSSVISESRAQDKIGFEDKKPADSADLECTVPETTHDSNDIAEVGVEPVLLHRNFDADADIVNENPGNALKIAGKESQEDVQIGVAAESVDKTNKKKKKKADKKKTDKTDASSSDVKAIAADGNAPTTKKVKSKKKLTGEEIRIKESNRVGAIENFNRIRKEKKKRELTSAPGPTELRIAALNKNISFAFDEDKPLVLRDGNAIVVMEEASAPCATGVFCMSPKTLRKPTDEARRQQAVAVQTNQEMKGKCVLM